MVLRLLLALALVSCASSDSHSVPAAITDFVPPRPTIDCSSEWPDSAMPCRMLAEAEARNVWIYIRGDAKSGHCSGVILETGHVLTAGHCAAAIMVVDGKPATVARISVPDDLLLLSVPTETFPPLQINKNPQATEMAYEVSNHNKYRGLVTLGRVVLVNDSEVCVQVLGAPGVSGSAIYDTRGRLMTISTHSHVATFGANASGILFSSGIHPKRVSAFLAAK